jgi:hypothetical protein
MKHQRGIVKRDPWFPMKNKLVARTQTVRRNRHDRRQRSHGSSWAFCNGAGSALIPRQEHGRSAGSESDETSPVRGGQCRVLCVLPRRGLPGALASRRLPSRIGAVCPSKAGQSPTLRGSRRLAQCRIVFARCCEPRFRRREKQSAGAKKSRTRIHTGLRPRISRI